MNKIELEKTYNPKHFEDKIYQNWEENGYFKPQTKSNEPPFIMVIPPPNVTGVLHMGHGLNNSLQDILARYYRMKGRPTLWLPGTDHAGIATQHVVERELKAQNLTKHDLGREKFLNKTWQVKEQHHDTIVEQLRKIGSSCDWSRERFTLDQGLNKAVNEVFVTLYERGLIYQGEYLVNWCTTCGTAIADDEVEYSDQQGSLYYLKYRLINGSQSLTVATTRPETIFGDVALAVHPEDERFKAFIGKKVLIPLTHRAIPVIADSYVDREFGTGVLKITPAHDINDYEVGKRHDLAFISIFNQDGKLNQHASEAFQGLTLLEARKAIAEALEKGQFLLKKEPHNHRVGHCYRCNTAIEPYLSKQWFVKMAPLATKALKAWENGEINFYPKRWENTYKSWLTSIRDWCISRQLWWGHRIPAWHCHDCGSVTVNRETPRVCSTCHSHNIEQDNDVLDTWFSSWLWPFSTLGWPNNESEDLQKFYPTSTLVTAYDIIFFWVARMIMAGLEFTGKVPFKDIFITPLVRDKQGRKMSKSLGNGIDPLEIVDLYGADALKFTIAYLSSQGQDLPLDKETFALGSKFCNKIWNASRYLLMNIDSGALAEKPILTLLDEWAYSALNQTIIEVDKAFKEYRFDDMTHAVYSYFWNDFCDWYIEGSKLSLYSNDQTEKNRAITVALNLLETSLRLLHPFVPFITEEIFLKLPNKTAESIIIASYPRYSHEKARKYEASNRAFEAVKGLITATRTLRSESKIPPEKKVSLSIRFDEDFAYEAQAKELTKLISALTKASSVNFMASTASDEAGSVSIASQGFTIFIDVKELINVQDEEQRTQKELLKMLALKDSASKKLANASFLAKAPADAVAKEQQKMHEAETVIAKLNAYLEQLKSF